ncbi:hypothetical protein E2I00_015517, partial [Balaenoptera physalus]
DYLDIFCPHYEGPGPPEGPETFALYMVDWPGYEACQAKGPGAFKRWECSLPFAPFGPVRFSEKIQRFTPFSLGFEFLPGETYYYISVPTPESPGQCLRLQVSVCCKEDKPESAHPVGSPGESGTSGWQGGATPSPLCLLLLLLLPILRLLRRTLPDTPRNQSPPKTPWRRAPAPYLSWEGQARQTRWNSDGGGRLGFDGIGSLSLLGAKAEDLGTGDCWTRSSKKPRLAICAQCPVGLFPGAAPFLPRGSPTCLL